MSYGKGKIVHSASVAGTVLDVNPNQGVTIYFIDAQNTTGALAYLQLFPYAAADVTLGTTPPRMSVGVPAMSHVTFPLPEGIMFGGSGLSIAATTARANSNASALDVNILYN